MQEIYKHSKDGIINDNNFDANFMSYIVNYFFFKDKCASWVIWKRKSENILILNDLFQVHYKKTYTIVNNMIMKGCAKHYKSEILFNGLK